MIDERRHTLQSLSLEASEMDPKHTNEVILSSSLLSTYKINRCVKNGNTVNNLQQYLMYFVVAIHIILQNQLLFSH